jgi:hypothetical protein
LTLSQPVGPDGEPVGPRGPYRPPVEDPETWRDEETRRGRGPRRPELSTTQVLLGLLVAVITLAAGAHFLTDSRSHGLEAAILSPDQGDRFPVGPLAIRFRSSCGCGTGHVWELAYAAPSAPEQWQVLQQGKGSAAPSLPGSGLFFLELTEPGAYRMRLVAHDGVGGSVEDSVQFSLADR